MPALEVSDLKQQCLLWNFTGYDAYGKPTVVSQPVEIPCRWVYRRREVTDPNGNTITLDGDIATDRSIHVGSHLWLGTLNTWNEAYFLLGSGSSLVDQELCAVVYYNNTPDVKGRNARFEYGIQRFHNSGAN